MHEIVDAIKDARSALNVWPEHARLVARIDAAMPKVAEMVEHASQIVCVYCGHIDRFESPEARWTEEGNARRVDHVLSCEKRPEARLLEMLLPAIALLRIGLDDGWNHKELEEARIVVEMFDAAGKPPAAAPAETRWYPCAKCGPDVEHSTPACPIPGWEK